ncbi:MAG: hypothetical protein ACRCX2_27295 [Paraclostridium sp.]
MNYAIDKENRRIILEATTLNLEQNIINEFDLLEKSFLEGTEDKYDCELVLLDVEVHDDEMNVVGVETKAFARRKGNEQWLMEFDAEEYKLKK